MSDKIVANEGKGRLQGQATDGASGGAIGGGSGGAVGEVKKKNVKELDIPPSNKGNNVKKANKGKARIREEPGAASRSTSPRLVS